MLTSSRIKLILLCTFIPTLLILWSLSNDNKDTNETVRDEKRTITLVEVEPVKVETVEVVQPIKAPEPPEPVDTTETIKSTSATPLNVSLDEHVIVISPADDKVPVNCLLTFTVVSTTPELAVVFNVLVVLCGNFAIAIFLLASLSFALVLVTDVLVDTSEPPTLAVSVACDCETTF